MINGKSVLAVIPARGGSKRVPGKNLREFNHPKLGKLPLLEIAIRMARQSKYIDHLIVSSEDEFIRRRANELNCASLIRPPQLATDTAKSEHVLLHAYYALPSDFLVLLQPTSPLRTAYDIDACIQLAIDPPCAISTTTDLQPNGAVYCAAAEYFLQHRHFHNPQHWIMTDERSLDIDTEEDLLR